MHIPSDIAGTRLSGFDREVTWRETMNYAACVNDNNPRYFDDAATEGVVAPPLYAVAVTWPLMTALQEQLKDAVAPEVFMTMVHASEHLIFHRPIRPGDRLRVQGRVAAVTPTPAGALLTLRLDATDPHGKLFFTEYSGALLRGVSCTDEGKSVESLPDAPKTDESRDPLCEIEIPIARNAAHLYDGCANIVFPIHTSVAFARAVGLPDILLQGTACLAMAAREIVNRNAGGAPENLREIGCRFSGMVIPGSVVRLQILKEEKTANETTLGFRLLNDQKKPALRFGFARLGLTS